MSRARIGVPLLGFVLLTAVAVGASDRPNLSGTWQLNDELSEDPRQKMQEAIDARGGGGRGSGGGITGGGGFGDGRGGSGRGSGGGRGGGSRGSGPGDSGDRLRALEEGSDLLRIAHADEGLTIVYSNDVERVLFTDGREMLLELERGLIDAKARQKKSGQIVFDAETTNGGHLSETWALSDDGEQLLLTVKLAGERGPAISWRRVYDAVADSGDEPIVSSDMG